MRKSLLILVVLALLAVAVPSAGAQGGNSAGYWFSGSGVWIQSCDTPSGMGDAGWISVQINAFVPMGYSEDYSYLGISPSWGDIQGSWTYVEKVGWSFSGAMAYIIPSDAEYTVSIQLYAPNGQLLTTAQIYASCVTGVIRVTSADIYGINDPANSQRVMATVLKDTPVYPAAAAVNPTSATLKAGQTWFVVGQTTAADGSVWYEVYVGGPVTGFVPASTLKLSGPVPTNGYHGTSPDPAPFPPENLLNAVV